MWTTFLPDLLVAVIGAGLTVLIALFTFMVQRRRTEDGLLRGLVSDIHHRRAFTAVDAERIVPDAKSQDDFARATRSVLSLKDEIKRTREGIRGDRGVQTQLSEMTRACNRYLEDSEFDPDRYWGHLMTLRSQLSSSIHRLGRDTRIESLEPGEAAF